MNPANLRSRLLRIAANKQVRRAVPFVFYALLILFLVLYLHDIDWDKLRGLHLGWGYFVFATLVGLAARYWQILVWLVLLFRLGATGLKPHRKQLAYIYAKSWMGRYIPGTAPWILGKIYFASQHGIPREKLAVSSLLEGALEIVTLLVLSFGMLLFDDRFHVINSSTRLFMGVAILACLVAMIPAIFNWFVSLAYRLMRHKKLAKEHLANGKAILSGAGLYVIGSLLSGISLFFIAKSIYPALSYHDMFFIVGASNLAGALGMIAIFAPSGIGVREGVLLVLLSTLMPRELALTITVFTRLWGVGVDVVFWGVSRAIAGRSATPKPSQGVE